MNCVKHPIFDPSHLAPVMEEGNLWLIPLWPHKDPLPANRYATKVVLLMFHQAVHELERRQDVTPIPEDPELPLVDGAAHSCEICDPVLDRTRLSHESSVRSNAKVEGQRKPGGGLLGRPSTSCCNKHDFPRGLQDHPFALAAVYQLALASPVH